MNDHRDQIVRTFNAFDGKNFDLLDQFYSRDVRFTDPVQEVNGLEKLKAYYAHAYKNVISIHFSFGEIIKDGVKYCAPWQMHLRVRGLNGGDPFSVEGCSVFEFDHNDRVIVQRDYLDLGAMVYERLPVQGFVISKIKELLRLSE